MLIRRTVPPCVLLLIAGCGESPVAPLPPLADVPPDLAAIELRAEGRLTAPYVMLELRQPGGFSGFVAINSDGQAVWYYRTRGSPFSFTQRGNGNFVLLDSERGLIEVTRSGAVVSGLAQEMRPGRRMHHDVTVTSRNTVLFLAEDWQPARGALLNGEALWEWDPRAGIAAKRWSSFAQLDPEHDWGTRSVQSDWLHANSVSYGPRGNVLVSLHFLNQIISLTPALDAIEWRLGGVRASVVVDDAFSGQHTAQEIRTDRVLLFDNGFERATERYSRAVEYQLRNGSASKVWEWRPTRDNWARVISSARRLPNGHTVVAFGTPRDMPAGATGPIEVYEITATGAVVWHLVVSGAVSSMYRATPFFSF